MAALHAVAHGTLDAVLAPVDLVPQGTPTTGVALSIHVALVATEAAANGAQPLLERLGPGDVVAVVRTPESVTWANDVIAATGATLQVTADRKAAYGALVAGTSRPSSTWSPTPGPRSSGDPPCGSPAAWMWERTTSSWRGVPTRSWWPRSMKRSDA